MAINRQDTLGRMTAYLSKKYHRRVEFLQMPNKGFIDDDDAVAVLVGGVHIGTVPPGHINPVALLDALSAEVRRHCEAG